MIQVKRITGGPLPTNCYILTDAETGKTAVIDPGFWDKNLMNAIEQAGIENVQAILLTHGHFDHLGGVLTVQGLTNAKVYLHKDDGEFPTEPLLNLANMLSWEPYRPFQADVLFAGGDTIPLGNLSIQVLHTPGHTAGSCCFLVEDALFTGDTLFCGSLGRTDFPTGSSRQIMQSLRLLAALPGDYKVYPGHEGETTLDYERKNNPYMENVQ